MLDLTGQNLGQYHVIERVGVGGMAAVFKAYQPGLDRDVAIKVLPPQTAQVEDFEERFIREAKAVAQLNHPNILPIYDVGIEGNISYFVMKYVPGQTLDDVMGGEPMAVKKAANFTVQVAEALNHAHNRGILHRDIKPANMLLDENDWLLLADFGLAKIVEGDDFLTATGMSMGTPSYASPEQVEGEPVDQRTDIYSLGIVMYEMFTGRLPYHGETPMSIMFKHVHEPLPLPRQVNPDVPEGIEQIILKATAKNREERYNTVSEMAADIKRFLKTGSVLVVTPIPALKSSSPSLPTADAALEQGTKFARKNWVTVAGVALVALVILIALGIFLGQQLGLSSSAEADAYEEEFNQSIKVHERRQALGGIFRLDDAYHDRGRVLFNKLLPEQKADLFISAPLHKDGTQDTRDIVLGTYSYLQDTEADNQLLAIMQTALGQSNESRDKSLANEIGNWLEGRAAVTSENYGQAEVAYGVAIGLNDENPATHFERGLVKAKQANYSGALADFEMAMSLNEDWQERASQAVQNNPELHIAAWEQQETYQEIAVLVPKPADTPTPTPLPTATDTPELDSQDALPTETSAPTDTPTLTPSPTDEPTPTATSTPAPVVQSSSGGGTYQLVYTKWDGGKHDLYVADTNGKNEQFILTRGAGPSWSADGSYIFFYGEAGVEQQIQNGVTYAINSADNKGVGSGIIRLNANPLPTTVEELLAFQSVGWNEGSARWTSASPNGEIVAYDAKPGGDYRIYFINAGGGPNLAFEIIGEQADWSPEGEQVVYRSGREGKTGIWISNRNDTGHTNITNDNDSFPTWSPDGKTIAFARDDGGNVDIYTVNVDGSDLKRLTNEPGPDTLPIYTPGGDIIFRSARSGSWGIWKMNRRGQSQTEIIPQAGVGGDWAYSKMDVK